MGIETLFSWVHPDYHAVDKRQLDDWAFLVEILATEPKCALLETRMVSKTLDAQGIESHLKLSSWSSLGGDDAVQRKSLARLGEIERRAKELLGGRYCLWDKTFVRLKEQARLVEWLQVVPRIFPLCSEPRLLRDIVCYGLGSCVEVQRFDFGLYSLAGDVHVVQEGVTEQVRRFGIPSCEKTLQTLERENQKYEVWRPAEIATFRPYYAKKNPDIFAVS